eukprot:TRINITY_DN8472_c0_g1_i1.p3 TRINITY_DN8472_c0_g1~~TRINITY_DN8472_c0_g1_i1.p3  ORF type:complete len:168 (+),score=25.87 TRINITY_DN8472_c0_g1_i1:624-1127(+)
MPTGSGSVSSRANSSGTVSPRAESSGTVSPGAKSSGTVSPGAKSSGTVSPGAKSSRTVSSGAIPTGSRSISSGSESTGTLMTAQGRSGACLVGPVLVESLGFAEIGAGGVAGVHVAPPSPRLISSFTISLNFAIFILESGAGTLAVAVHPMRRGTVACLNGKRALKE